MRRILYMIVGFAALVLGTMGTVIPAFPTVPFYMLAAFCFAKSSQKLHSWFTNTKIYKDNLSDFAAGRGMPIGAKVRIMGMVTLLMAIGFLAMRQMVIGQIILGCVWMLHILYFLFGIKTFQSEDG